MVDGYIDNIRTIVLDMGDWLRKAVNAAPLVIHSLFRPIDEKDSLPRNDTISLCKLKCKGTTNEFELILGWKIDTRRFRIYLPMENSIEWATSIQEILEQSTVTTKVLESTITRLDHVGYIIPQGQYFLNQLRHILQHCKALKPQHPPSYQRWSSPMD